MPALTRLVVTFVLVVLPSAAFAASVPMLDIDINSLTIRSFDGFGGTGNEVPFDGITHTGSLVLGTDEGANPTHLAALSIDLVAQTAPTLSSISGFIDLNNGMIDGGNVTVAVDGTSTATDTYTFDLVGGSGQMHDFRPFNFGFFLSADTEEGRFSGPTFGVVDVALWDKFEPLDGTFVQFKFEPDAAGLDMDADVDLRVLAVVPVPSSLWTGLSLLACLGSFRLYRRMRRHALP